MMYPYQSTGTFQKYFPDLTSANTTSSPTITDGEHAPPRDSFLRHHPFCIARLTSAILTPKAEAVACEFTTRTSLRILPAPFASIVQSASPSPSGAACPATGDEGAAALAEEIRERACEEERRGTRNTWNDMPKFLLAGAISTIISRTCVAPLERMKLECIVIRGVGRGGGGGSLAEVARRIWVTEGPGGFWRGNLLNLFRTIPFKSINFLCYDLYCDSILTLRRRRRRRGSTNNNHDKEITITNHDRLVGGAISGITATVLCLPLDTIRTRLVAPGGEALGGVEGCFFHMVRNEGFLSLYKGITPAVISMGPASAIFYAVYDFLKASHRRRRRRRRLEDDGDNARNDDQVGIVSTLIYGAVAGACAETVTYPLEVIRRQLQLQQRAGLGLASTFVRLVEKDGVRSLFAGLLPSTLQVLPSASLSYLFYEMMKSILKIN